MLVCSIFTVSREHLVYATCAISNFHCFTRLLYPNELSVQLSLFSGTWFTAFFWQPWGGEKWMTGITMATRDWTWLDHCWPSFSEGKDLLAFLVKA